MALPEGFKPPTPGSEESVHCCILPSKMPGNFGSFSLTFVCGCPRSFTGDIVRVVVTLGKDIFHWMLKAGNHPLSIEHPITLYQVDWRVVLPHLNDFGFRQRQPDELDSRQEVLPCLALHFPTSLQGEAISTAKSG